MALPMDRLWRRVVATVGNRALVTDRDLAVLSFAVEMFGLPLPLVAELVRREATEPLSPASADRIARRTVARLEAGRYARRTVIRREVWLVPRAAGLAMAQQPDQDEPYGLWQPQGWKAEHIAAIARLRLWLTDHYPGSRWESERAIRRRWAAYHKQVGLDTRTRYADGALHFPDGRVFGIELELHIKPADMYVGIVADQDPAWTGGVWWFTRVAHVMALRRVLEDAGAVDHTVIALSGDLAPVIGARS
jgi:hypothetical protein